MLNEKLKELKEDLEIARIKERKVIWIGNNLDIEYTYRLKKGSNLRYRVPVTPLSVLPLIEELNTLIKSNAITESEIHNISKELEGITSKSYDKANVYNEIIEPYKFTVGIRMIGKIVNGERTVKKYAASLEGLVKETSIERLLNKYHGFISDVLEDICGERKNIFDTEEEAQNVVDELNIRLFNMLSDSCTALNDILTFTEAAKMWGLNNSTLRKLVTTDKLVGGVDYRKSGNTWLITKGAMERIYSKQKDE